MPPRRRTITVPAVRRPRVAGQPPATRRGEPDRADPALDPALDHGSAVDTDPADGGTATGTAAVASGPAPDDPAPDGPAPGRDTGNGSGPRPAARRAPAHRLPEGTAAPDPDPATTPDAADGPAGTGDDDAATGGSRTAPRGRLAGLRTVPVLAAALVVLLAAAAFFGAGIVTLRGSAATANTALTDVAATSEVTAQLGDALELIYSYDFARLDENERAAREVISPAFTAQFDPLYAQVRELAPQVQAVVSAVVTASAVQSIEGDRAVLVVFMDQQATTVADGQQAASAGRLTVTGVRIDGRWKVDSVESR